MNAKELIVAPIPSKNASEFVRRHHYSGKVAANSQLHLGVFWRDRLEGVMQFGPSMDKRKTQTLVSGTGWNSFLELNRMAFSDVLPRNSESRALAVGFRMIKKHYPHVEWVVSFSDASQCGDGTIYRAAGFLLTQIRENRSIIRFPDGEAVVSLSITSGEQTKRRLCAKWGIPYYSASSAQPFLSIGAEYVPGFQLRYIYFLNPSARSRLTAPILKFSEIQKRGAGMYLGKPKRAGGDTTDTAGLQPAEGGSIPTPALHFPTA
jgi:hypothetical protein